MGGMDQAGGAGANLTRALTERVTETSYETLPRETRRIARQCVLDFFAVTLAGAAEPLVHILLDDSLAEGPGSATVIGHKARLSPLAASLVNGAASHALDYDDVNLAMPGHPTVAILPGLLALAEQKRAAGRTLIEAFIAGYETQCRIGASMKPGHYNLGFHATGTIGSFGAAAACARLIGLDPVGTARALGIAGTQAAGLKSMFGTMCKPFHAGKASENGLRAVRLAARGFTTREDVVECLQGFAGTHGPDFAPEVALAEPPHRFYLRANLFKYHAACYLTHASIENAAGLRRENDLRPEDVERITIRMDRSCDRVCNIPEPRDGLQTKFSVRHTVAMALAGIDTAGLASYTEATATSPPLVALRRRVAIDFQEGWPEALSEMVVELRDGRRLEARHDAGVPATDLDAQEAKLLAKFDALVTPVLGPERTRRLRDFVLHLDEVGDVAELLRAAAG